MARKRISPTLLTDGVSLVKGERFQSWRTVGSVVAAAQVFSMRDVDELCLLDVNANTENRTISEALISSVAECMSVPLIAGGGVKNLNDFEKVLRSGADKVVLGTVAWENPRFVTEAANRFGSQAVVVSVDCSGIEPSKILIHSGKMAVDESPLEFAVLAAASGAGEILLQNVERDGRLCGMDNSMISKISSAVDVPVIASGGAGSYEDILDAIQAGAESVSAGAMFRFTEQTPKGARDFLAANGIDVRVAD